MPHNSAASAHMQFSLAPKAKAERVISKPWTFSVDNSTRGSNLDRFGTLIIGRERNCHATE